MLPLLIALAQPAPQPPKPTLRVPTLAWKVPLASDSFGGAAIADADSDGALDVAFGTYFGDGTIHVLRGKDGTELWHYTPETAACIDASMRWIDTDADGKLELIAPISNLSRVHCFDGATGKERWTCRLPAPECIDTSPWLGNADTDPALEVVVGTFAGNYHVIDAKAGDNTRTLHVAPGAVQSCPILLDLNADGTLDFIAGNFNGDHALHAVNGADGKELWAVKTGSHIYHGPAVGDLDADGKPELVFGSYDGAIRCVGLDGTVRWTVKPGDRYFMSPVAIADLDNDGKPEAISASQNITAIKHDGAILWSVPADESHGFESVTRGVAIADLDNDGAPDLAYLNGAGLFRVLHARDGAVIYEIDCAKAAGHSVAHSSHGPTIADLTGDGKLDVFLVVGDSSNKAKRFGTAMCLTGFEGTGKGWPMLRHDPKNTGNTLTAQGP